LLDDTEYKSESAKYLFRFICSVAISLGALALGLTLLRMIRRQNQMAAELQLGHEREERLEELTRLGAGLAHETKNPLSVIRGLAQSCAQNPARADEERIRARQIVDEADRVVGRINSFLRYSSPRRPEMKPIDLDIILADCVSLFADEAAANQIQLTGPTKKARTMADSDMLRQIAVNLLANALKACGKGDSISMEIQSAQNGRLGFFVTDTGVGIEPLDLPMATKPYFTRSEGGTGLGLAIVGQIVRSHEWILEIESRPAKGTTVKIRGIQEAPTQ